MENWSGFTFERGSAAYLEGDDPFPACESGNPPSCRARGEQADSQTLSLAQGGTDIAKVYFERMGWEAVTESTKKPNGRVMNAAAAKQRRTGTRESGMA
jgi:hypothetical protein